MGRQVDGDACFTLGDALRVINRRGVLFGDCQQEFERCGQFRSLSGRET